MEKRYWVHEPTKGTKEIYDSDDWFSVTLIWIVAKVIGVAIIAGIVFLLSLF